MNIYKYLNKHINISIKITSRFTKTLVLFQTTNLIKVLTQKSPKITTLAPHKANWQKGFIKLTKHTLISYLIVSTVLFGSGIIFLFNPFGTTTADAAWFNDNWSYRKSVPITAHTAAETDKYISVTIADTDDLVTASQLQSDCGDMRFTKQNGDIIPYYISSGCNSTSTVIHIYFDSFPAGAQTLYFYYGNPSVSNGADSSDFTTEASSYTVGTIGSEEKSPSVLAYWRFDDAQGSTAQDSTTNNNPVTLAASTANPTWQTEDQCIAGKCLYFDGSNDYAETAAAPTLDIGGTTNFSLSTWIRISGKPSVGGSYWQAIAFSETGQGSGDYDKILRINTSGYADFYVYDGNPKNATGSTDLSDGQWHHLTGTYDGTNIRLYVDGQLQATTAASGSQNFTTPQIVFSHHPGTNIFFKGFIDEPKIYQTALSASQVTANYNARNNPDGTSSVLGANTQNMPAALSNGLAGYWKMDEGTSTTANDSSGNSNTGTLTNSPTWATGKYSYATSFAGSNQHINAGSGSSLDDLTTLTVSAWIYPTTVSGWHVIARKGTSGNGWSFQQSDNILEFQADCSGGAYKETGQNGTTLTTNTWHFVTLVWTGGCTNPNATLYVNAVDELGLVTSNGSGSYNSDAGQDLMIAIDGDGTSGDFEGSIDEMRIYNRALSPAEVSQLYNWAPGPVGYWKMDDKTGTSTIDVSSNGNTGTLTNSPTWTNGKYNGGIDINTSVATNQYINVPAATAVNDMPALTISGWIKYRDQGTSSAGTLMGKVNTSTNLSGWLFRFNGSATHNLGFFVDYDTTDLAISSNFGLSSGVPLCGSSTSGAPSDWCHVAVTWDGGTSSSGVKIYVNGKESPSYSATSAVGTRVSDATSPLRIGNNGTLNRSINGVADDFQTYNYVRTQAQIIEDMNAGHPAPGSPISSTIATWKLDEGYGTSAQDWSGNSNTLTLSTATSSWTNNGKYLKAFSGGGTRWMSKSDDADFDIEAADSFAISMWYRSDSATDPAATEYLIAKGPLSAAGYAIYANTDGTLCFGIDDDATWNPDVSTCTATDFYDGNWHHITGVRNTVSDTISIYIDGQQKDSDTDTTSASLANSASLYVADVNGTDNGNEFVGSIDEIKFYRSALTAPQIGLDMNRSQSEVLGALSDSSTAGNDNASTRTAQSNASAYCVPGDSSTCTGPAGEWNLDEGSGTNAQDSSTNGNTGTITAGSGSYVNGKINKAYTFDGSSTLVNAGSGSSLDNLPASGMTAEAWIYPTGAGEGNAGFILAKNNGSSQNAGWLFLTLNTGGPTRALQFVIDGSTDLVKTTSDSVYSYNTWNHVAVTSNSNFSAGSVHIYVNGKEVTYSGSSGGSSRVSDAASSFYIGNASSGDRTFAGIIDQVKVYNYERTPAQISWSYNQGKPIAHWKIDECQGTTINDMSGNSETGTLTIGGTGGNTTAGTCTTSGAWFDGVTGKRNYSIDLDGTDDYITMGTASYGLQTGDAPFAIALWAKPSATRFDGCYFSYGAASSGQVISLCAQNSNRIYSVHYGNDNAFNTTWTLGSWQHVILSYNPTTSTESLYVNGQLMETWTPSNLNLQSSATSYIGRASWSGTYAGATQIDDVRLYNYPLTANQAKTLFNEGATRYGPVTGAP